MAESNIYSTMNSDEEIVFANFINTFSENTNLPLSRQELVKSEKLFQLLLHTMPNGCWTNRPDGEVTFYNKHFYLTTGTSPQAPLKDAWQYNIHPDDLEGTKGMYQQILESGQPGELENRVSNPEGEYRWHLSRLIPIKDNENNIHLWLGSSTDVHDLKLLQQHKDDFINVASHELKTPLTSLKTSLEILHLLKNNPSSEMVPVLIDQSFRSIKKITHLIESLLNANKIKDGLFSLSKRWFAIGEVFDECKLLLSTETQQKLKMYGNFDLKIFADPERICQVISNFINNAMKYAPDSKEIVIRIEVQKNLLRINVIDQGQGIEEHYISKLFERYYKIENEGITYSGLGLGLYISSEIIKKHCGKIGVESKKGAGSNFWFTLPFNGND